MRTFKIAHRYPDQPEQPDNNVNKAQILVPYLAITDNIQYLCFRSTNDIVELSDGTLCKTISVAHINIDNAEEIVRKLYKVSAKYYLNKWKTILPAVGDELCLIKLEKINEKM